LGGFSIDEGGIFLDFHPRSGSLFGFEQLRKVRTDETTDCARLAWLEVMKANSTQLAFITSS
jgi:hypothetical protein